MSSIKATLRYHFHTRNTVGLLCLCSGNMCNMLSPGSVLLSASGSLAFKSCARYEDTASYKAPEVQRGHAASSRAAAEKVGKFWLRIENNKNMHSAHL